MRLDPADDRTGADLRAVPEDRLGVRERVAEGRERVGVRDRVVEGTERVGARDLVVDGIERVDPPDLAVEGMVRDGVRAPDVDGVRDDGVLRFEGRPRITGMDPVEVARSPLRVSGVRTEPAAGRPAGVVREPVEPPGRVAGIPRTPEVDGRVDRTPVEGVRIAGVPPRVPGVVLADPSSPVRGVNTGLPRVGRVRGSRRTAPGVVERGRDTGGTDPPDPIPAPLRRGAALPGIPGRPPSEGRGRTEGLQGSPTPRSLKTKRGCLQTGGRT